MRASSLAFALLAGIAAACGVGLFGASWWQMLQVGAGMVGLAGAGMAWLDWSDWVADQEARRRREHAQAERIEVETALLRQPAPLAAAEPALRTPAAPDDRGWYLAVEITLFCGQVSGFTDTGLTPIMGSDARPKMQKFLTDRGVLELRPSGYGWADGVTLADALRRLRAGDLAPFPDDPAPKVTPPIQPATRRDPPRRAAKVVDSTARAVE